MTYGILIENQGELYNPLVVGEVTWSTERIGSPGKLEFKVLKDKVIDFQEGNPVRFQVDGKDVFFGYVWTKSRDKQQLISVTAYDQLRYLKYKDTYIYTEKKASDLVKMIAEDRNLKVGEIEDTGYVIAQRIRDNETFLDMIYDALNLTLDNTKQMYVLYDDCGRIVLKNLVSMRLNLIVGENIAENFDYSTGLDDTYNQIKLAYDNQSTGKREIYIVSNGENINAWGLLQYYEKINEQTNGVAKANALLELYNRKSRTLELKGALGDVRVRGGSSLMVYLPELGDISVQNYMLVESATHTFSENKHLMDLKLKGRM